MSEPPSPPFLAMRHIVKRFPGVLANDDVSFEVGRGEIHALLGENGAGKSTLMQILYGLYQRDEGEILIDGHLVRINNARDAIEHGIGMIHQEFMLVRPFSVVENIVLGLDQPGRALLDLDGAAAELRVLSERHGLAIDPSARVEHLPIGVQQRVEILKLLYRKARLLILDEPTAVLTPQEKSGLFAVLRGMAAEGRSIVIVTHKLHEIMQVSDRVTVMRDGRVTASVRTRDTSAAELARLMVGRDVVLRVDKPAVSRGQVVLKVAALTARDQAGTPRLRGIDFDLHEGEILGVAGVDGNGQSELAAALLNLCAIDGGRIMLGDEDVTQASPAAHRAKGLAFVPADRRWVGSVGGLPITENAILGTHTQRTRLGGLIRDDPANRSFARDLIARFGVRTPSVAHLAGTLSGGNLQKLVLGREMMRNPRVLIVEQPTRGLDVGAIETVWAELLTARSAGKAILLISAELEEIMNLADRIAVIFEGRIVGVLDAADAHPDLLGLMMAGAAPQADVAPPAGTTLQ